MQNFALSPYRIIALSPYRPIALLFLILTACAPAPIEPVAAQGTVIQAWQANQHTVWDIDWPDAPVAGRVTVESWQADHSYRFEILEAPAPALVGQALVFNGQTAWQYDRLYPPSSFEPAQPQLAPITEAYATVDRLLDRSPQTATRETAQINFRPAQKISLTYPQGDTLTVWLDSETTLPVQVRFSSGRQIATLTARSSEPLINPPPDLFSVGDWLRSEK